MNPSETSPVVPNRDPVPNLIRQLSDPDPAARLAALQDIGRLGPLAGEAMPVLHELLFDNDAGVRKSAARTLGLMGPLAINPLADALSHDDHAVRRQAVWALARLGTKAREVIPAICQALKDRDGKTASGAAQALGNMGPVATSAVPALLGALQNANAVHCRLVAWALSEIGPSALPALVRKLPDADPFVRREAAIAIGLMGPKAQPAVGPILLRLRDLAPTCAQQGKNPEPGEDARRTHPIRSRRDSTELHDERVPLIETLARIGPAAAEAREYLIATLDDLDPIVARAASQALLRIIGWN